MQELKNKSDNELVKLAQAGDAAATEELLNRYKNSVRARARQFFLAGGETEDLVQEGMVGLYCAIRDYREEPGKSFKNFAYLCVSRRVYDAIAKTTTQKSIALNESVSIFDTALEEILDSSASPEETLLSREERAEFKAKLMKTLSDFEFRVFSMYMEGLSYTQISEALSTPTRSVEAKDVDNALTRAKKKLRKAYER